MNSKNMYKTCARPKMDIRSSFEYLQDENGWRMVTYNLIGWYEMGMNGMVKKIIRVNNYEYDSVKKWLDTCPNGPDILVMFWSLYHYQY